MSYARSTPCACRATALDRLHSIFDGITHMRFTIVCDPIVLWPKECFGYEVPVASANLCTNRCAISLLCAAAMFRVC